MQCWVWWNHNIKFSSLIFKKSCESNQFFHSSVLNTIVSTFLSFEVFSQKKKERSRTIWFQPHRQRWPFTSMNSDSFLWLLFFSHWVVSDSLWSHGLQHTRLPCPSLPPGVGSESRPLSGWCYLTISSSAVAFPFPIGKLKIFEKSIYRA